ncbi:hypothetical protein P9112_013850 [Eukaryota sp. TZLM1-RC]
MRFTIPLLLLALCSLAYASRFHYEINVPDIPEPPSNIADIVDYGFVIPDIKFLGSLGRAFVNTLRSLPRYTLLDPDALSQGQYKFKFTAMDSTVPHLDDQDDLTSYMLGHTIPMVLPAFLFVLFTLILVFWLLWIIIKLSFCCCVCCSKKKDKTKVSAPMCCRGTFMVFLFIIFLSVLLAYSSNMIIHDGVMTFGDAPSSFDPVVEVAADVALRGVDVAADLLKHLSTLNNTIWELLPSSDRVVTSFSCFTENLVLLPNATALLIEIRKIDEMVEALPDVDVLNGEIDKIFSAKDDLPDDLTNFKTSVVAIADSIDLIDGNFLPELENLVNQLEGSLTTAHSNIGDVISEVENTEAQLSPVDLDAFLTSINDLSDTSSNLQSSFDTLLSDVTNTNSLKFVKKFSDDVNKILVEQELIDDLSHFVDGEAIITEEQGKGLPNDLNNADYDSKNDLISRIEAINAEVSNWNDVSSRTDELATRLESLPDFDGIADELTNVNASITEGKSQIEALSDHVEALETLQSEFDVTDLKSHLQTLKSTLSTINLQDLKSKISTLDTSKGGLPDLGQLEDDIRSFITAINNLPDFGEGSVFQNELSKLTEAFELIPNLDIIKHEVVKINSTFDLVACLEDPLNMFTEINDTIIELPPQANDILDMINEVIDLVNDLDRTEIDQNIQNILETETPEVPDIQPLLDDLNSIADSINSVENLNLDQLADDVAAIDGDLNDFIDLADVLEKIDEMIAKIDDLPEISPLLADLDSISHELENIDFSTIKNDIKSLEDSLDEVDDSQITTAITELGTLKDLDLPDFDGDFNDEIQLLIGHKDAFTTGYNQCHSDLTGCDETTCNVDCSGLASFVDTFDADVSAVEEARDNCDSLSKSIEDLGIDQVLEDLEDVSGKLDIDFSAQITQLDNAKDSLDNVDFVEIKSDLTNAQQAINDRPNMGDLEQDINDLSTKVNDLPDLNSFSNDVDEFVDAIDDLNQQDMKDDIQEIEEIPEKLPDVDDIISPLESVEEIQSFFPEDLDDFIEQGHDFIDEYYVNGGQLVDEYFDMGREYLDDGKELVHNATTAWEDFKNDENLNLWTETVRQGDYLRAIGFISPFLFVIIAVIFGVCAITCCQNKCCLCCFNIFIILSGVILSLLAVLFLPVSVVLADGCAIYESGQLAEYVPRINEEIAVFQNQTVVVNSTELVNYYFSTCEEDSKPVDIGVYDLVDYSIQTFYHDNLDQEFDLDGFTLSINTFRDGPRADIDTISDWVDSDVREYANDVYDTIFSCSTLSPVTQLFTKPLCEDFVTGFSLYGFSCLLIALMAFMSLFCSCCCAKPKWKKPKQYKKNSKEQEEEMVPMMFQPSISGVAFQFNSLKTDEKQNLLPQ